MIVVCRVQCPKLRKQFGIGVYETPSKQTPSTFLMKTILTENGSCETFWGAYQLDLAYAVSLGLESNLHALLTPIDNINTRMPLYIHHSEHTGGLD